MKVVTGLGNPGKEYADTPHNVGFMVVDELAGRCAVKLRRSLRFKARMCEAQCGASSGSKVLLVKPQTYMNLSGLTVGALLRYRRIPLAELVVIYDDADLPLGTVRIRQSGSAGGHRGVASIIEQTGGHSFTRVRLGIGRSSSSEGLVKHVLSPFAAADRPIVEDMLGVAADAVECIVNKGSAEAMNRFNARSASKNEAG